MGLSRSSMFYFKSLIIINTYNNYRFKYKDEYEKFKLVLSVIGFVLAVINLKTNFR